MRNRIRVLAAGGVFSAFAVAIMLLGSFLPLAVFVAPAFASLCVLYFVIEHGFKAALCVFFVISILSLLLAADKESAFIFCCVIGYYPLLKTQTERTMTRLLQWAVKFGFFNFSLLALYVVLTRIFVLASVREEFSQYSLPLLALLLLLANVTLYCYDRALTTLAFLYLAKLRSRIFSST